MVQIKMTVKVMAKGEQVRKLTAQWLDASFVNSIEKNPWQVAGVDDGSHTNFDMTPRRLWVEALTCLLFAIEFGTNVLRYVQLGRRYYEGSERIDGQVVVITGANSGIGKETAYQLAKRGGKVSLDEANQSPRSKLIEFVCSR